MENDRQQLLAEVENLYRRRAPISEVWPIMHELAEAQFLPAKSLFADFLEDEDWRWREEGINLLGFHFDLENDQEILDTFRRFLESDPETSIRISAANALASQTSWPELSLFKAIEVEIDEHVRRAIFGAILSQAGLPPYRLLEEEKKLKGKANLFDLKEVKRILVSEGINLDWPE
jgi:hypothetical protein